MTYLARAQQPALPVIGFVDAGSADTSAGMVAAFRKGFGETGYLSWLSGIQQLAGADRPRGAGTDRGGRATG
jgi:hypothetical protein